MTALMYNRRVSKCHARVEAYGAVDELNAALGLARAAARSKTLRRRLEDLQSEKAALQKEKEAVREEVARILAQVESLG